ncbi:MAG TPA: c-type cytochrome domain-containing protein, partial [Acidobacteriaceae bacterium]|nr:c-type cytochrome domain-containing protein [Acidobacteriaceae bacterium]
HADWQQFLGRFHPLAVHIPIGLIVLVPVLEIAGTFRPALREAAGFVLGLGFISCLGTLTLGYLLAYGSGDVGAGVTRHMWGGIALTIGVLICVLARPWWTSGNVPRVYPLLLAGVLLVLGYAAHQGGSLTHGSNYLTAYMPASLKRVLTLGIVTASAPAPGSFYAKHINPILDENCVSCHGEAKTKGGLRLDSYELLMRGGKHGGVIIPGKPEQSLLLKRVTLPPDHKQFMPAEGKPPLKPEEIAWIRAWILDGASSTAIHVAGVSIHEAPDELPLQPVGDYSAMMPEILQMAKGQGAKLIPVSSKPSDGLILNTVDVASSFGDAQLIQLQKFAPYIVEAELGRTAVTNASFDTLAKFTHLRALHLEGTAVTGDGLQKLAPLSQLTYLNLSGSKLAKTALASLAVMKNLRHVYLYNTPAQPAPAAPAMQLIARNSNESSTK